MKKLQGKKLYKIKKDKQKAYLFYAKIQVEKAYMNMYDDILERLSKSTFRVRFKLRDKEKQYIEQKGLDKIKSHAEDFIRDRVSPSIITNDGKQTPMKGHPVFIAQHATATCCRGCINKWHKIPKDVELTQEQQDYIVGLIMEWIKIQIG